MYYSWRKIIKNCQFFVCIRVHSLYIILCGSTFGFNYISNSVYIGLCRHNIRIFFFLQKSSNCKKTSSSQICYIYIYAFSRRFYPKRLTIAFRLYIFISMCVPWESNPQPFALLTQCSTTEPQEHCYTSEVCPLTQRHCWTLIYLFFFFVFFLAGCGIWCIVINLNFFN